MKQKKLFIGLLFAVLVLGGGGILHAEIFYWVPGNETWGSFRDPANWKVESEDGGTATVWPKASDEVKDIVAKVGDGYESPSTVLFDLGGEINDVGTWSRYTDWSVCDLGISNGTFRILSNYATRRGETHIYKDGIFALGPNCKFIPGIGGGGVGDVYVHDGGTFLCEGGKLELRFFNLFVKEGGRAEIKQFSEFKTDNGNANKIENEGSLEFPDGMTLHHTPWGATVTIVQKSGTLLLGGPLVNQSKNDHFRTKFYGGTVKVTAPIGFDYVSVEIPNENTTLTLDVAEGVTVDLQPFFNASESVQFIVKGDGFVCATADDFSQFSLAGGGVALTTPNGTYDFTNVLAAESEGAVVRLDVSVIIAGTVSEKITFKADLSSHAFGAPIVTCEDVATLEKIKTDLAAFAPVGSAVAVIGNQLMLVVDSQYVFDGSSDITSPTAWKGGEVPVGQEVFIKGEGVKAVVSDTLPEFASITVTDGAEFSIEVDSADTVALPPIVLSDTAKLTVKSGTATLLQGFSSKVTAETIPALTIDTDAKLQINQATQIKNVNLAVAGTLEQTEPGHLVLGSANTGETTHFGLTVDNGTFLLAGGNGGNTSDLKIASPEAGGTVVVPREISITGMLLSSTTGDNGLQIGINNPESEKFTVLFEKTYFIDSGYMSGRFDSAILRRNGPMRSLFQLGGGATLVLGSGCIFENQYNTNGKDVGFLITDIAQLKIENGGVYNQYAHGKMWNHGTELNPSQEDHVCLVVGEGGTFLHGTMPGNNKGVVKIDNGLVKMPYGDAFEGPNTKPFRGARAILVPEGSTATFEGTGITWRNNDKILTWAVPFIGGGTVRVTYALFENAAKKFYISLTSANNNLTGDLVVEDVPEADMKVVFCNGANWAGTVHSRNVELDHVGTSTSTNAFGALHLDGDFQMAVTADGVSDFLAMGAGGFAGDGRLVFPENLDYDKFGKFVFGSAPSAETPLPVVKAAGRKAALKEREDGLFDLVLQRNSFVIIVR